MVCPGHCKYPVDFENIFLYYLFIPTGIGAFYMHSKSPFKWMISMLLLAAIACSTPVISATSSPHLSENEIQTAVARSVAETAQVQAAIDLGVAGTMAPGQQGLPPIPSPAPNEQGQIAGATAGSGCTDRAELVTETIDAGKVFPPQTGFTNTWFIRNVGTCTWTNDYLFSFLGGNQMEAISFVNLGSGVQPDQSVPITITMKSPVIEGSYVGEWILKNASGINFGWGPGGEKTFDISINVDEAALAMPGSGLTDPSIQFTVPAVGGGPGSVPIDTDADGLEDWLEDNLANAFRPYFEFDEEEPEDKYSILRFYQVTPIYKNGGNWWGFPDYQFPEYDGPPGILITYVLAYRNDKGDPILGLYDHIGDAEMIRILIVNPPNQPSVWKPAVIIMKRHFDDPQFYYNGEKYFGKPQYWPDGTHIQVYVSEAKHAMYLYEDECEDYSHYGEYAEDCGGGYPLNEEIIPGVDGFNVGERSNHPVSKIPENLRVNIYNEFFWSNRPESDYPIYDRDYGNVIGYADKADRYCGGYILPIYLKSPLSEADCGGGMDGKWFPMKDQDSQRLLVEHLSEKANRFFQNEYGAEYEICVYTGHELYSGTDLHLNVTLHSSYNSQVFNWIDYGYDVFEPGGIDCFRLGSYGMEDDLANIKLFVWSGLPEQDSEWELNGITVTDLSTGKYWGFSCYCWMDLTSGYDAESGQTTIGPLVTLQRDP
jgi:hypothetical protein